MPMTYNTRKPKSIYQRIYVPTVRYFLTSHYIEWKRNPTDNTVNIHKVSQEVRLFQHHGKRSGVWIKKHGRSGMV